MGKDTLKVLGASNHTTAERSKLDYYGTDPRTTRALLSAEHFSNDIWEPASGHGLIVKELAKAGYNVYSTDIADYGEQDELVDFFATDKDWSGDMVMNPPYGIATEFVVKALSLLKPGRKLAALVRLQFLEGQKRKELIFSKNPPKTVYIFVNRQVCSKEDDFTVGSAVAYTWLVWEKGYTGNPEIIWLQSEK